MNHSNIKFNINSFTGDHYHIGFALGRLFRWKNPLFKLFLHHPLFPRPSTESINKMSDLLSEFDPELLLEMKGFADSSGISFGEVLVKLGGYGFQPKMLSGCTQIAVLPEITSNKHLLVGRNYDFSNKKIFSDRQLISIFPDTGFAVSGMSQFVLGRIEGVNNQGLYAGISLAHGKGGSDYGIFAPTIVRILLDKCKSAIEATDLIQKIPHSDSYNFLIADKLNAYAVEASPPQIFIREPENGFITVCNHYCSSKLKNEQKRIIPTTIERTKTVARIINEGGAVDFETVRAILAGHSAKGVCLHHYKDFLGTIWSAVFDLTAGDVFYSFGSPCLNDYRKIDFNSREIVTLRVKGKIPGDESF